MLLIPPEVRRQRQLFGARSPTIDDRLDGLVHQLARVRRDCFVLNPKQRQLVDQTSVEASIGRWQALACSIGNHALSV
jgi:hypothetical protein